MNIKKIVQGVLGFLIMLRSHLSFKLNQMFFSAISLLAIVLIVISSLQINSIPVSALSQPTTPTIPICGLRKASDIERATVPVNLPSQASVNQITPDGTTAISDYHYWPGDSSNHARWYIEQSVSNSNSTENFLVYDATDSSKLGSFSVTLPANLIGETMLSTFAVDAAGNVYVGTYNQQTGGGGGSISQWLWSPGQTVATRGWSAVTTNLLVGALYGYTDTNGVYRIAAVEGGTGANAHTELDSVTFNASNGSAMSSNGIVGSRVVSANAHNNDLVVNDGNDSVYIWNSTATTRTFYMTNGGQYQLGRISGATELNDGTIVTGSSAGPMVFFSPNGLLLGKINSGGLNDPIDVINNNSPMFVVNSRIYYSAENLYSFPNKLSYVEIATEQAYVAAPQGAPFILGMGAQITTPAAYNFFPSGTTPEVDISFAQSWQSQSGNFTGTYTIRTMDQVHAGVSGTSTNFSIPSSNGAYTNGVAKVQLSLPEAAPGYYEVGVNLSQNGTVVGAACTGYSIGASNVSFSYPISGGTDTKGVELAAMLGQKIYRSSYNLNKCYSSGGTTLACPSDVDSDIAAAQSLADQYGIIYDFQLGADGLDSWISGGTWEIAVQQLVTHFPEIKYWECWNEPDNNTFRTASDYVTNALQPCHTAVNAANSTNNKTAKLIGISIPDGTVAKYQAYVDAGALSYLDIVAFHGYPGWNRSFAEDGDVIPSTYGASGEVGYVQALQKYLADHGYTGTLMDTENGYNLTNDNYPQDPDPADFYSQGDRYVTKMILEQSIGVPSAYLDNASGNNYSLAYWSLINGPYGSIVNPGGLAALNYSANLNGRNFISWITTGIPHVYAAKYGPSPTVTNDVVVVWADDYAVNSVPTLSGGGNITVTDEYGKSSTVSSGSSLLLNGQVQYISVPSGKTLSIAAAENFGTNYALDSGGATANATSSYCGVDSASITASAQSVLYGIANTEGKNIISSCNNRQNGSDIGWAPSNGDADPSLTINLPNQQTVNRIFISSSSLGSSITGLRNYKIKVSSTIGGPLTDVASVNDQFFNRNNLVSIASQPVQQIVITGLQINYSGHADGLPPLWWDHASWDLAPIYDVEVYGPGNSGVVTSPPTASIAQPNQISPQGTTYALTQGTSYPINVSPTDHSGTGIANVKLYIDGSLVNTIAAAPFNFEVNTLPLSNGTHSVSIKTYDNSGSFGTTTDTITVNNGDLNNDASVNIADLSIMANYWGNGTTYAHGNVKNYSVTNIVDLSVLGKNWNWHG